MAQNAELDKLLGSASREAQEAVRRAYKLGCEQGAQKERARLEEVFAQAGFVRASKPGPEKSALTPPSSVQYGVISTAVKGALRALSHIKEGVTAQDVIDQIARGPEGSVAVDIVQARTALKVLAKAKQIRRLERGRYIAGPALLQSDLLGTEGAANTVN